MTFFYSNDNRFFKVNSDSPPMLTQKGLTDHYAAMKIQRWWKRYNRRDTSISEETELTLDESGTSLSSSYDSLFVNIEQLRKRFKRKHDEIEEDDEINYGASCEDNNEESEEENCEDNESNWEEYESEDDMQVQHINNNNFLWDFLMSFIVFFQRLFRF